MRRDEHPPAPSRDPRRLLATLERLLAITAPTLRDTLQDASDALAEALQAEKTDAFLYDRASDSLVALGTSQTPLGQRQRALALHRQPLSQGGSAVWTYTMHHQQHADSGKARLQGWAQDTAGQVLAAPEVYTGEVLLSPAEQSRASAQEGVARLPRSAHCPPPGVATTTIRLLHPGRCAVSAASTGWRSRIGRETGPWLARRCPCARRGHSPAER